MSMNVLTYPWWTIFSPVIQLTVGVLTSCGRLKRTIVEVKTKSVFHSLMKEKWADPPIEELLNSSILGLKAFRKPQHPTTLTLTRDHKKIQKQWKMRWKRQRLQRQGFFIECYRQVRRPVSKYCKRHHYLVMLWNFRVCGQLWQPERWILEAEVDRRRKRWVGWQSGTENYQWLNLSIVDWEVGEGTWWPRLPSWHKMMMMISSIYHRQE